MMVIFILGTLGNIVSLIVMLRPTMRTSSSAFYLSSLAVADTVVLLVGCLRRWVFEVFGEDLLNESAAACYSLNFLQYWSFDVAVWILVAMTIDRVIVVMAPLKSHLYATKKRASIALVSLMILCAIINCHLFATTYLKESPGGNICTARAEYDDFFEHIWSWLDASIYSFIPFTVLLILNIIIILSMSRADRRKRQMTNRLHTPRSKADRRGAINPRKMTVMLLSVTSVFILLTAPSMGLMIVRKRGELYFDFTNYRDVAKYTLIRQIARILLYLNHGINFFLYCITGTKFRRELASLLRCQSSKERRRELNMRSSMASIPTSTTAAPSYSRCASQQSN